jgi:mRNA interferase RelE/StbE
MYRTIIQPTAFKLLKEIADRRIRQKISDRIEKPKESPQIQRKPLRNELTRNKNVHSTLFGVEQRIRIT